MAQRHLFPGMSHPHTGAMPMVSVVMPFFNEERYLEEAVQSVRDQTLADWELILVDDGSTDQSSMIARNLSAQDGRIRYVDHPGHENRGRSASRNVGVAHADAPYIAFLDADDVSLPSKLAEQVDLLESMPDVAVVAGATEHWYSWNPASIRGDRIVPAGTWWRGMADERLDPPEAMLALYPLGHGTSIGVTGLVRRSVFDTVGGFEDRFRGLYDDQAFLAKIYLEYPIYISSRIWYRYRQHDTSCCGATSRADYWRLRGLFLDWLGTYLGPHGDARVVAAVRRARRKVPYGRLTAPVFEMFDRLPGRFQERWRVLARRNPGYPKAPDAPAWHS
jgi:glycosyltransferase involved in cell wall biosynthesis